MENVGCDLFDSSAAGLAHLSQNCACPQGTSVKRSRAAMQYHEAFLVAFSNRLHHCRICSHCRLRCRLSVGASRPCCCCCHSFSLTLVLQVYAAQTRPPCAPYLTGYPVHDELPSKTIGTQECNWASTSPGNTGNLL